MILRKPEPGSIWQARLPQLGALGVFGFILGGMWDVAWHVELGRESFWTPPHLLLYAGLSLILGCLALGLVQAWRLRQVGRSLVGPRMPLPFGLQINPGLVIAGLGALMSLTSAPVDDAWHRTFGLDVTIWSPPHLQLIFGVAIAALGLLAALAGELNHADGRRRRESMLPLDADPRTWTLLEYDFAVPHYALGYYPLILSFVGPAVLLLGARASGRRWAATAIVLLFLGAQGLLQLELTLLGRIRPTLILIPAAGPAVDLLWQHWRQSPRPLTAAGVGIVAALAALAIEVPYLVLFSPLPWLEVNWLIVLPAASALGALGGIVGARVGAALRPEPASLGTDVRLALGVGLALAALVAFLIPGGSALAGEAERSFAPRSPAASEARQGVEPVAIVSLDDPRVVVGQPATFRVRLVPSEVAADVSRVEMSLQQAQVRLEPEVRPTGEPGAFVVRATLPTPGRWVFGLRLRTDERTLEGWLRVRVGTEPGGAVSNAREQRLELLPGPGVSEQQASDQLLLLGKVLVWTFTGLLLLGVAWCLWLIEADARRLSRT